MRSTVQTPGEESRKVERCAKERPAVGAGLGVHDAKATCERKDTSREREPVTHASPSSSESAFPRPPFFLPDLPGATELSLLMFIGASSSSEEESPARARSSSSTSDISF